VVTPTLRAVAKELSAADSAGELLAFEPPQVDLCTKVGGPAAGPLANTHLRGCYEAMAVGRARRAGWSVQFRR